MDGDDLYGLALDRFVPERTALARRLRGDGRREAAVQVAALRKPSVAAWAVNQLVRTQEAAVQELWQAGDALRQAQTEVVTGRAPANALRLAMEQERAAADNLTGRARGLLRATGHELSPAMIDRVTETLHAAALDADARELVREGRLVRELRHIGLGEGGGGASGASATTAPASRRARGSQTPAKVAAKPGPSADRAREGRVAEREAERRRAGERKATRAREAQARREAERADKAVRAATRRQESAAQALAEADAVLAAARAAADDAAAALRRAQAALNDP